MKRTLLISPVKPDNSKGFTLVELLVSIGITAMLGVVIVAYMASSLTQVALSTTRSNMSSSLQTALIRVSDDIRTSSNPALCNLIPDANAPATLTGLSTSVPCPSDSANTDQQKFWRLTANQLVMNRTPQTLTGQSIYDDPETLAGKRDTIIYYVRGDALYKRVVAAPYTTPIANAITTTTCNPAITTGGCDSDTKILEGLDTAAAGGPFVVTYYDGNGNTLSTTSNHTALISARSVSVELKMKKTQSGQDVSRQSSARMQFRGTQTTLSPLNPPIPVNPDPFSPSVYVGPGGLRVTGANSVLKGADIYVKGRVTMDSFGMIGDPTARINMAVANIGCGTTATFPVSCSPTEPITGQGGFVDRGIHGKVCAPGQTTQSGIYRNYVSYSNQGTLGAVSCTLGAVTMPTYNKGSFTSKMTQTRTGAQGSCAYGSSGGIFEDKTTYNGNVSMPFCSKTLEGDIYIKGDLDIGTIYVSSSLGSKRPIVIVNGKINFEGGGNIVPNDSGATPYFISFHSSNAGCSNSDTCNTISNQDMKNTLDTFNDNNAAIKFGHSRTSTSTFYAYFGEVKVGLLAVLNGPISGQGVRMSAGGTVEISGSGYPVPNR